LKARETRQGSSRTATFGENGREQKARKGLQARGKEIAIVALVSEDRPNIAAKSREVLLEGRPRRRETAKQKT